jgi:prepilin-type processing-associated H-X9-DG protein
MGLASPEQIVEAQALISSNPKAAEIHSKIKATLAPLDSIETEACPDDLVERTMLRVRNSAVSGEDRLQQLLASEQRRVSTAGGRHWMDFARRFAVAAVFLIAASVLYPTFSHLRQNSLRQQCQMQQSALFQGLTNFDSDHDGGQPVVATAAGAPWYKLGDQGSENHSNTRRLYLLVKGGYAEPGCFVCPSCSKSSRPPQLAPSQIQNYRDFPDRRYITYSFQIRCREPKSGKLVYRKVLLADLSPLFEDLPKDFKKPFKLSLNKKLLTVNSINHNRRGQNVLFADGHIEFLRTRQIGDSHDDIFTLRDIDEYQGCEVPSCETDFFLAP